MSRTLLIVEDDPVVLRTLARRLGDRSVTCAGSATEARALLASSLDLSGLLLDVGLPEGPRAGVELLDWIRQSVAYVPCALLTGTYDPTIVNVANRLRSTVIIKPAADDLLAWLLERVDRFAEEDPSSAIARNAQTDFGLTTRETEIVAWSLAGRGVAEFLSHIGISRTTFKEHRRNILAKTNASSLELLASRLLHEELRRRS